MLCLSRNRRFLAHKKPLVFFSGPRFWARLLCIIILIGFAIIVIGILGSSAGTGERPKVAVGGFIGFIPFGFMNDRRMFWPLVALMAASVVVWFLMRPSFAHQ